MSKEYEIDSDSVQNEEIIKKEIYDEIYEKGKKDIEQLYEDDFDERQYFLSNNQELMQKQMRDQNFRRKRKNRTTISKEILGEMNKIFTKYTELKENGSEVKINLKSIGNQLELGYSTILHKYREFRANKKVEGGKLISNLSRRRKYKKSVFVEKVIEDSLEAQPFYTAVELAQYIKNKYGIAFSRSIISRHLGELGYSYKNLKVDYENFNTHRFKEIRKIYADMLDALLKDDQNIIYLDQFICNLEDQTNQQKNQTNQQEIEVNQHKNLANQQESQANQHEDEVNQYKDPANLQKNQDKIEEKGEKNINHEQKYISVVIFCTSDGIIYYQIRAGYFKRKLFYEVLKDFLQKIRNSEVCRNLEGRHHELYMVMDMNKCHRDNDSGEPGISKILVQNNVELFYLPPESQQLNPASSIFNQLKTQLKEKHIYSLADLQSEIENIMGELNQEPTEKYFNEVRVWLDKSLKQEDF